jgi:light-regulated signal transduction histidine kinase (bacteriophytochrome)
VPEEGQTTGPDELAAAPADPAGVVAALEARIRELERSNADLERFASIASHDLQAPLGVIAGFVELLRRRYTGRLDDQADEIIRRTVAATQRMQRLTDDLLLHARASAGTDDPAEPVDTEAVVDEVLDTLGPLIADAGVTVETPDLPTVAGHRSLLVRLFQNHVSNAVKFAGDDEPRIRIDAVRDGAMWRFAVQDNGLGIDADARERIFELFERVHAGDRFPGHGIGLAVCRQIVDRHGGTIEADGTPGGGTVFSFTLPAVAD